MSLDQEWGDGGMEWLWSWLGGFGGSDEVRLA